VPDPPAASPLGHPFASRAHGYRFYCKDRVCGAMAAWGGSARGGHRRGDEHGFYFRRAARCSFVFVEVTLYPFAALLLEHRGIVVASATALVSAQSARPGDDFASVMPPQADDCNANRFHERGGVFRNAEARAAKPETFYLSVGVFSPSRLHALRFVDSIRYDFPLCSLQGSSLIP